jgi:hypothetical protein
MTNDTTHTLKELMTNNTTHHEGTKVPSGCVVLLVISSSRVCVVLLVISSFSVCVVLLGISSFRVCGIIGHYFLHGVWDYWSLVPS